MLLDYESLKKVKKIVNGYSNFGAKVKDLLFKFKFSEEKEHIRRYKIKII